MCAYTHFTATYINSLAYSTHINLHTPTHRECHAYFYIDSRCRGLDSL